LHSELVHEVHPARARKKEKKTTTGRNGTTHNGSVRKGGREDRKSGEHSKDERRKHAPGEDGALEAAPNPIHAV